MIKPIIQNDQPYITQGAEKPDLANGSFMTFHDDNGYVAHLQMTNDRIIWLKQVDPEGKCIINLTFGAPCAEPLINYLNQRLKETEK